ncbi:alpha/beta hydrolase [Caryophanon latum]|uniref:Alpha/beta hydrolase fold-3 domain-containing protein n=1 Tax=Caryophanon latum TaxID=33977 RepID=A0A1C0YZF7_9BACL|nr:alpha/beta hydrolase [Caryophanon latum]OCS92531.1 hypothetical protein A6K76_06515 [Caryophanon latum]
MKKRIAGLAIAAAAYCYLSPKPASYIVRAAFKNGLATAPPNFHTLRAHYSVNRNLRYRSHFSMNTYDLFVNRTKQQKPLIIWVHGGAYVGGDKEDVAIYASMLAANGFDVVTMNYALAPEATYPTPLLQLAELYTHIVTHHADTVTINNIFFAGDSAGAQIAAQFVVSQLDESYAKKITVPQVVPPASIAGTILCCGPYDLAQLDTLSSKKWLAALLHRAGWAYMNDRHWQTSTNTANASLIGHIPPNFPPTFLTDGNAFTFTSHTQALAQELADKQIEHDVVLYDEADAQLLHEYQFLLDTPHAQQTFERLVTFLTRYCRN